MSEFMQQSYPQVSFQSIPVGDFFHYLDVKEFGMEKKYYEQRRMDLSAYVERLGRGSIARIAREAEIDASYLSRCLYPPGRDGRKNIGDEIVSKLDAKFPDWRGDSDADSSIYKLRPANDRQKAISELVAVAEQLDIHGISKLIERATVLLEQHPAKETLSSSA